MIHIWSNIWPIVSPYKNSYRYHFDLIISFVICTICMLILLASTLTSYYYYFFSLSIIMLLKILDFVLSKPSLLDTDLYRFVLFNPSVFFVMFYLFMAACLNLIMLEMSEQRKKFQVLYIKHLFYAQHPVSHLLYLNLKGCFL